MPIAVRFDDRKQLRQNRQRSAARRWDLFRGFVSKEAPLLETTPSGQSKPQPTKRFPDESPLQSEIEPALATRRNPVGLRRFAYETEQCGISRYQIGKTKGDKSPLFQTSPVTAPRNVSWVAFGGELKSNSNCSGGGAKRARRRSLSSP